MTEASGESVEQTRSRVTEGLSGEVLEVGFGTRRNVAHSPAAITRVLAVEPVTRARSIAAPRVHRSAVPIEYVGLDGQQLPLPDASIDHVLITWTLCTIPAVARALTEIERVLRPGGTLRFVEHGRSRQVRTSRRQDRLTPLWGKVAGGCHLNRSIPDLIAGSGLSMTDLHTYQVPHTGPSASCSKDRRPNSRSPDASYLS